MNVKRVFSLLLTYCVVVGCLLVTGTAHEISMMPEALVQAETVEPRATDRFTVVIPAASALQASDAFSLDRGETVTISAEYTPTSASVDIGLLDESERFTYVSGSGGSVSGRISVSSTGKYVLVVRNNSSTAITISGTVRY